MTGDAAGGRLAGDLERPSPADADQQASAASVGVAGVADVLERPADGADAADVTEPTEAPRRPGPGAALRALARRTLAVLVLLLLIGVVWEGAKFVGGDTWRYDDFLGLGFPVLHDPPLKIAQATDRSLPHLWDIAAALGQPAPRSGGLTLGAYLVDAAIFTWREAVIGFAIGTLIGLVLAAVFVHSRLLERAFMPYAIGSQAVPIVALAPLIVVGLGRGIVAVVVIATYLTFFPVTIAALRGFSSPDPRALELMRSYAASRATVFWKVRFPASLPYLFTALKIAATGSIVGAIIGEGPGGVPAGLGRAISTFNQQYVTGPERLWATILVASLLGIVFFALVRIAEALVLRGRRAAE